MITKGLRLQGEDNLQVDSLQEVFALTRIAERINTGMDELGPSIWALYWELPNHQVKSDAAVVFSRGEAPNHDLIALVTKDDTYHSSIYDFHTDSLVEISLQSLNSPQDEGYPTWTPEFGNILFHSNRDGKYRIYQATLPANTPDMSGPFAWLRNPGTAGLAVSKVEALASLDGEERCPLLVGNRLYFVSDRSGGQGGFDIYRSAWSGSDWSPPENLGSTINSPSNEYRPFAFHLAKPIGPVEPVGMLFSSDRPGGLGGYDLYLAALPPPK